MSTKSEFVTVKREVLQQALDALWQTATPKGEEAITALRAALEQPGVEPVYYRSPTGSGHYKYSRFSAALDHPEPLYTAPQPAQQAFSDDMVLAACRAVHPNLFKHGLKPLAGDGPHWRAQMAEAERDVRKVLEAATGAEPQPAQQPTPRYEPTDEGIGND